MQKPLSLTIKSNGGLLSVLQTSAQIFIQTNEPPTGGVVITAIWDTGASNTAITTKVVQSLGLQPSGVTQVSTANGTAMQNTYLVMIGLPNGVLVEGIVATEVPALSGNCDALIGMDIIGLGDFSITNYKGNTCMSFRVPSQHEVDYVAQANKPKNSNITPPKKKRSKK